MTALPRAPWVLALAAVLSAPAALAQAPAGDAPRTALKVCQDPNNLPFSNVKGEGIENRIAEVFGQSLGLPVTYYSFPQRMAFIRNTLRYKLPGKDYPCDIVMGVPAEFDQVSTTKPYYRSTYALVVRKAGALAGVSTVEQFLALDRGTRDKLRIGVFDRSPASEWLNRKGLVDQGVPYKLLDADPEQYPGQVVERDLTQGQLDAAIVWGPIAGYYAKRVGGGQLTVIPLRSEPGMRLDYPMAMGVRYGERDWKQQVETTLEARRPEILAILREYNVPLVDERGAPLAD